MRKEKGVTLVALIITIIITLILASVTVTVVLNGNLFKIGKTATDKTKNDLKKEQELGTVEENSTTGELVSKYSDNKITNLTGTTWEFKDSIIYSNDLEYNITGTVYNDKYRYNYSGLNTVQAFGYYIFCWNFTNHPYENEYAFAFIPSNNLGYPNAWVWGTFNTNDITLTNTPTLEITGGEDVTNPELIEWLNENATKK